MARDPLGLSVDPFVSALPWVEPRPLSVLSKPFATELHVGPSFILKVFKFCDFFSSKYPS